MNRIYKTREHLAAIPPRKSPILVRYLMASVDCWKFDESIWARQSWPSVSIFSLLFPLLLKYGSCVASKVRLGDAGWAPLQSLSCVLLRNSSRPLNTISHQYEFDWFSCFPPVILLSLCIDPLEKDEWLWRRGCQECNEWGGSVCRLAALLLNIASRFLVSYHRAHIRSTSYRVTNMVVEEIFVEIKLTFPS